MVAVTSTAATRALKERQKNRNLPTIEAPQVKEAELARVLLGLQEHIRMYEGDSGAPKERFVTLAELENTGLITADVKNRFAYVSKVLGQDVAQLAGSTANPTWLGSLKNDTSRTSRTPGGGHSDGAGSTSSKHYLNDHKDVSFGNPALNEFLYFNGHKFTTFPLFRTANSWVATQQFEGPLRMRERAAAIKSLAGMGQLWVKDDGPTTLYFTDDAGTDYQLGSSLPAGDDTELQFNDAGVFGASANLTWDDTTLKVDGGDSDAPSLSANVSGNTPDVIAIATDSSLASKYEPLRANLTGTNFWAAEVEYVSGFVNTFRLKHNGSLDDSPGTVLYATSDGDLRFGYGLSSGVFREYSDTTVPPVGYYNRLKVGTNEVLSLQERTAPYPHDVEDGAGLGQLWVYSGDTPNTLWFTDDGGNDVQLGLGSTAYDWGDHAAAGYVDTTGALSAAEIPFMSDADTIETEATFVYDKANNRLGVGTDSPAYALHVVEGTMTVEKSTQTNLTGLNFDNKQHSVGTETVQFFPRLTDEADATVGAGRLRFGKSEPWTSTNSTRSSYFALSTRNADVMTEHLRVTADGYLGIGTDSPSKTLEVVSDGDTAFAQLVAYGTDKNSQVRGQKANGSLASPSAVLDEELIFAFSARGYGATGWAASSGVVSFVAAENFTDSAQGTDLNIKLVAPGTTSKTLVAEFKGTGDVTIPNGQLGVGTDSPTDTLHVDGGTSTTVLFEFDDIAGGYGEFRFKDDTANKWSIGLNRNGVAFANAFYIFQYTDAASAAVNTVRIAINDDGYVGIGTGTTAPTAQLEVKQGDTAGALPVLKLEQLDVDDTFIDFVGTSAADGSKSISSDTTEDSAKFGAIRIEINGTTKWLRVYDTES